MDTNQPNALRLAELHANHALAWTEGSEPHRLRAETASELRRLHAENEALRTGYDAARLEIESLQARVQELGQMARDCNSRRVLELEAQLDAIGAGGVEPLRKRECLHKIDEPDHFRGATQMVQASAPVVPVANCYSDDDGDSWRDRPDDCEFVKGRALGEEFELQASMRSWTEVFRVTKVPDENSDDYEVEPVSMRTTSAPQAQADAPVVLPAPDVFAKVSHKGAAKWDVEFTWPVGKFEEDGDHKLYTEQQVRAMLAAAPKPPAHEPLRCCAAAQKGDAPK